MFGPSIYYVAQGQCSCGWLGPYNKRKVKNNSNSGRLWAKNRAWLELEDHRSLCDGDSSTARGWIAACPMCSTYRSELWLDSGDAVNDWKTHMATHSSAQVAGYVKKLEHARQKQRENDLPYRARLGLP